MMKALLMTVLILFAGIAAQAKEEKPCPFRANNSLFEKTTPAVAKASSAAPKGLKARGIRE